MATLLLIGGTGFFGKSFLDSFLRNDLSEWNIDKVIVLSRNAKNLRNLAPQLLDHRIELVDADIATVDSLPAADFVIHAAASTDARNYLFRPDVERANIQGAVNNYCRLAPKFHAESKIVYASSGAVYGVQPPDLDFLSESHPLPLLDDMPDNKRDYAAAKRDAEGEFKKLGALGLNVSIARCFSFVGPWLPRDQHFAIGNFLQDGLLNRPIQVNATHPVFRSYMYADDLVKWLMVMAANATHKCETYNVGSDEPISIKELARQVAQILKVESHMPDDIEHLVDRYVPSISKAKISLGLCLTTDLNKSLQKTIARIQP